MGGGEGGDVCERRDVGELCVCGWRWGERREVLHVILFRGGGGVSKYFGKAPCSSLAISATRLLGGFRGVLP